MKVENHGRLRKIELPQGWVEAKRDAEPLSAQVVRIFHAPQTDSTQVRLSFGGQAHGTAGTAFVDMLSLPGHDLGADELKAIVPILGMMADARWFAIERAHTRELAGRKTLHVAGRYVQDPYAMTTVFIDTDDSGAYVQEISFVSPAKGAEGEQSWLDEIMASIEWLD